MCCKKRQQVKVFACHHDAALPFYATPGAAAADVHSVAWQGTDGQFYEGDCLIPAGEAIVFRTGLKFEVPEGYELKVYSRSGHGFKSGIRLSNCTGILDSDYRGELMVKLHNDSDEVYHVCRGERVCQIQVKEVVQHEFVQANSLNETERGEGGFGSTGKV